MRAARGELVAVVGESGSGKSLTLRAIAGLLPHGIAVCGGRIDSRAPTWPTPGRRSSAACAGAPSE